MLFTVVLRSNALSDNFIPFERKIHVRSLRTALRIMGSWTQLDGWTSLFIGNELVTCECHPCYTDEIEGDRWYEYCKWRIQKIFKEAMY